MPEIIFFLKQLSLTPGYSHVKFKIYIKKKLRHHNIPAWRSTTDILFSFS